MKNLLILPLLMTSMAFASERGAIETGDYTTVAIGAAEVAGTGYISYKKFSGADEMREGSRRMILQNKGSAQALDNLQVKRLQGEIQKGEEIRYKYHRGPEANKQLHLNRMINAAESARSSASSNRTYAMMAMTETKRVQTGTNAQGTPIYTTVPDPKPFKALMYNNMAADDDARAARIMSEHAVAGTKPASSFEVIKLEKVFDTRKAGVNPAKIFISEMTGEGGKFYQSSEIPAKVVAQASKMKVIGTISAVGAVLGTAFVVEELFHGAASNLFKDEERDTSSHDWRGLSSSQEAETSAGAIRQ